MTFINRRLLFRLIFLFNVFYSLHFRAMGIVGLCLPFTIVPVREALGYHNNQYTKKALPVRVFKVVDEEEVSPASA